MINGTERDLVQRFVDSLTDCAIVILDINGRILTWNAGARALLGYSSEEIVGRSFSDLRTKSDVLLGKADTSLKDALQWGRHDTTGRLVGKDGNRVEARVVLRPLSDSWQRLVGFGMLAYAVDGAVVLPPVVRAKPEPAEVVRLRGNARILVVDDNTDVLEEAVEQLTKLGYEVASATSGTDAMDILERDNNLDLLFTDVVMPGELAGRALAQKARELRPALKVLFASGYFEGALVSKGDLETDVQFIAKPYRMRDLALKIEEVLRLPS
ncbi:hypothetical protein BH11PSE3_BH11PSE3_02600 [soil metagenome]